MSGAKIVAGGAKMERMAKALERAARGGAEFAAGARAVNRIIAEEGGGEEFSAAAVHWVEETARLAEFRAMVIREALSEESPGDGDAGGEA